MRAAAARAASRRGSRTRIFLLAAHGSFAKTSGTRVVLPAPGGATSTAVVPRASAAMRSGVAASMGRGANAVIRYVLSTTVSSSGLTGRSSNHRPGVLDCPVKPGNDTLGVNYPKNAYKSRLGGRYRSARQCDALLRSHAHEDPVAYRGPERRVCPGEQDNIADLDAEIQVFPEKHLGIHDAGANSIEVSAFRLPLRQLDVFGPDRHDHGLEIGRASCRERV